MRVIFLQDVSNIAHKGDIEDVKNGYARNFLIPKGLARRATSQDIKSFEKREEKRELQKKKELEKNKELSKKMEGKEFELEYKAGEEGQLFESVTDEKIAQALQEEGFDIQKDQVKMEKPIKSIGEFSVDLDLGEDLKPKIIVTIKKTEE